MTQSLPQHSQILHFGFQNGEPFIWVLHPVDYEDPDFPVNLQDYHFKIYGTGHTIQEPHKLVHIQTAFNPPFVWHLFKKTH